MMRHSSRSWSLARGCDGDRDRVGCRRGFQMCASPIFGRRARLPVMRGHGSRFGGALYCLHCVDSGSASVPGVGLAARSPEEAPAAAAPQLQLPCSSSRSASRRPALT